MFRRPALAFALFSIALPALAQDVLRGHGGPVRALAVNAAQRELVSGSFDSTVIVWDLDRNVAKRVLRFHAGPVNAVAVLQDGCVASGGEDRRIAIWCGQADRPVRVLEGHEAPVTALVGHGGGLFSGSFDGTVRSWDYLTGQAKPPLMKLKAAVSTVDVVRNIDGQPVGISSGAADGTVMTTAVHPDFRVLLAAPVTVLAAAADDELIAACADGQLRFLGALGKITAELEVDAIPLVALALSPDGRLIATAGLRGGIAIIDRASRKIIHRFTGPGLPVWSLVFDTDNRTLLSGGADRVIRRWDAVAGKPLGSALPERDVVAEAAAGGERGAQVFRACQACHTLGPDDGNRAGPTLAGIFGRRIGTAPSYDYSDGFARQDIVWGRDTIARLFEVGPTAYTPGTKMPEQTITSAADRQALVDWLERVTAAR